MKMNEILFCLLVVLNVCSVWAQPKTLKFGKMEILKSFSLPMFIINTMIKPILR